MGMTHSHDWGGVVRVGIEMTREGEGEGERGGGMS